MRQRAFGESGPTIFTIGHSTRSFSDFLALLQENRTEFLADVRHFPTSQRVPWATKAPLQRELASRGVGYQHFEDLGGYRKARPDSVNMAWRSSGFRGYADHMATPAFEAALERLLAVGAERRSTIMCAEAVPWKCHRSLLSDALVARGARVVHILGPGKTQVHRLTKIAKVRGGRVTYPGPSGKGV